jgi:hypothetical protein
MQQPARRSLAPPHAEDALISDWKFFLDNEDWLNRWAQRYGESAGRTLAEELRRSPWRAGGGESHKK